jgi:hypothetical protein
MIFKVIECQLFNSSFYQITTIRRMPRKNVTALNRLLDVRPDLFGERLFLVGESLGVGPGARRLAGVGWTFYILGLTAHFNELCHCEEPAGLCAGATRQPLRMHGMEVV